MTRMNRKNVLLAATAGLLQVGGLLSPAHAANMSWNGGGADNSWSDGLNWIGGVAPAANDALVFDGTTQMGPFNDTAVDTSYAGITFNATAGAFTLSGNSLTLGGDIVNNSGFVQTISTPLTIAASRTFNAGTAGLTIGAINDTGPAGNAQEIILVGNNGKLAGPITAAPGTNGQRIRLNTANDTDAWSFTGNNVSNIDVGQIYITRGTMNFGVAGDAGNAPTVNINNRFAAGGTGELFTVGNTVGGTGVFNMNNGTVVLNATNGASPATPRWITANQSGGTGNFVMNGGYMQLIGFTEVLLANQGGAATTSFSNFTMNAGSFISNAGVSIATRGLSTFTMNGGYAQFQSGTFGLTRGTTSNAISAGTVLLNGGTLAVNGVQKGTNGNGTFIFNGGWLRANTGTTNFLQNVGSFTVLVRGAANIDTNGNDVTAAAVMAHDPSVTTDGGLTKVNGGNLSLSGDNTYNGPTTVSGGQLTIGAAGTTGSLQSPTVALAGGTTLNFNRTNTGTHAFVISGAGAVNQIGTGVTVLTGANTYTGGTNVTAGGLAINGSLPAAGTVNVNGGNLGGTGSAGSVTLNSGSIRPGASTADANVGTVTMSNLLVNGGDFRMDLTSPGVNDNVTVTGATNFAGPATFTLANVAGAGSYSLLNSATNITYGATPTLNAPTGSRFTFGLDTSTDAKRVLLSISGTAKTLVWSGAAGVTWDLANTVNWNDAGNGATADEQFFNLDTISFDDTAASKSVTLDGTQTVQPASTVVNTAGNYSITGAGTITGSGSFTKSGAGSLTLGINAAWTGGTNVQNGTLVLASATALPATGNVTLGSGATGGVLDLNGQNPIIGGLATSGTAGAANVVTSSGGDATVATSVSSTFGGIIQDGPTGAHVGVTVNGGTLTLTNNSTYTRGTIISAGARMALGAGTTTGLVPFANFTNSGTLIINHSDTVTVADNIAGTGTVTNSLGTLSVGNGGTSGALSTGRINNNGTLVYNHSDNITVANVISGTGTLRKQSTNVATFSGNSGYTGNTVIEAGTAVVTTATSGGSSSFGSSAGTGGSGSVNIVSGAAMDLSGNAANNGLNFGVKKFFVAGTGVGGTGAILNNGTSQQNTFQSLALTADALIGGTQRIDVRGATTTTASGTLNLGGFTLTSNNAAQFSIVGAAVTDGNIVGNGAVGTLGILSIEAGTNIPDFASGKTITYNAPAGGQVTAQFFQNTGTVTRPMVFNTGSGTIQIGNASNTAATIGSNMTLNGDVAILPRNAAGTGQLTLTGAIGGTGAINKTADNGGNNTLVLAGNNTYAGVTTISAGTIQIGGGTTSGTLGPAAVTDNANLAFNRSDTLTVANTISGTGAVFQKGTGTTVLSGVNSYTGATNVNAGHLVIGNGDAIGSGASLLNIAAGATAHVGAALPKAVKVNGLTNAGKLDVNDGKVVIDYAGTSPVATIRSQLVSGYASGSWNGIGINTAAPVNVGGHVRAVGYAEATEAGVANTTWNGQAVDGDAVLTRYTLAGDGDLNGTVDLTDFTFLAGHFNQLGGASWINGDYNYDGNVDLTDFTFLAGNFNQTLPADAAPAAQAQSLGSVVPEPGSFSVLAMSAGLLASRRRYRRSR